MPNPMGPTPRRGGLPSPGQGTSLSTQCVVGTGGGNLWSGGTERSGESGWNDGNGESDENTETDGMNAGAGRKGR